MQCIINWWDAPPREVMEAESTTRVSEGPDKFMAIEQHSWSCFFRHFSSDTWWGQGGY